MPREKTKLKRKRRGIEILGLDESAEIKKGKALKVTVFFAGHRREWSEESGPKAELSMLKYTIEQETKVDYGYPMDLLLVNHYPNEKDLKYDDKFKDEEGYKTYIDFFNSLNGTETKNGKIITHDQENKAVSGVGWDYAYQKYKNDYDYWYFCEDDVITIKDNVMARAVRALEQLEDVIFISTLGWWKHATVKKRVPRGWIGITKTNYIEKYFTDKEGHILGTTSDACYWEERGFKHNQHDEVLISITPQLDHNKRIEIIPIGSSVVKWKHEERKLDSGPSVVSPWNQDMERF